VSSKRVRIVGGGLTGILAALKAHDLGCREIDLHERFDALGGVARPHEADGLEVRDGCVYFGPRGDAMRGLLEDHGLQFDDFDNRFGSVSPGANGDLGTHDFGGPALPTTNPRLTPPGGDSLRDRIAAYPADIAQALTRYCEWHLGPVLDEAHESAAIPLAINRVFPLGPAIEDIAEGKRSDPLQDELYAIPRGLWGWRNNVTASLPRDGFQTFFVQCRKRLERLGVRVHDTSLVSPRQLLSEPSPGEAVVWAANPMPLFKVVGIPAPPLIKKNFATYAFKATYGGSLPFYVQNFTATGAIFRIYLYETRGQAIALAECVREADEDELRAEISRLMTDFEGASLSLGEQVGASVGPRWIYQSVEAMRKLRDLRGAFTQTMGPAFIPGAWEPYSKAEKFAEVNAGLSAALDVAGDPVVRTAAA
jgi:hypothetical protein